ncbi:MAG TPA: hypothetical protein PLJ60_13265 [Chryseolinea sp.]|nr:hypothetical protein [Chryseolinea sp.]
MKKLPVVPVFFAFMLFLIQSCSSDPTDPSGRIIISTTPGNIETIAGLGPLNFDYTGDGGLATSAKLGWITAITLSSSGDVYITDGSANTVREINASTGKISTIAGTFIGFNEIDPTPFAGDGGLATLSHLNIPLSIGVDGSNNIVILDAGNNVVRQITSSDSKISSIIGTRMQGYTGDGGLAISATLFNPYSIAIDPSDNIYIAESGNHVVRMITKSTGKITTIAGLGPDHAGYTGDSDAATEAELNGPSGIAVDADGDIYISDTGNNVVRKISGGIITTIAGTGALGYSGDGGDATSATFNSLKGIAVDHLGNVYVADSGNNAIRKIDTTTGEISTLAGTGAVGYSGDGGLASSAKLSGPLGVAVDADGNIFIADTGNNAIRVVTK